MTSNDLQYEMDFHNKMKNSSCPQGIKFRYNMCKQGRIQPVSLGGAISGIFGSQFSVPVHYCKRHEVGLYFTTLLWQKMDVKMALYHECCFPNCTKSWWIKLLS